MSQISLTLQHQSRLDHIRELVAALMTGNQGNSVTVSVEPEIIVDGQATKVSISRRAGNRITVALFARNDEDWELDEQRSEKFTMRGEPGTGRGYDAFGMPPDPLSEPLTQEDVDLIISQCAAALNIQ
jgi:hypothetical protein